MMTRHASRPIDWFPVLIRPGWIDHEWKGWLPDWLAGRQAGNEMWDLGIVLPSHFGNSQAAATTTTTASSIVVAVAPGIKLGVLALFHFLSSSPMLFMSFQMINHIIWVVKKAIAFHF
jgi:hypothetical protein